MTIQVSRAEIHLYRWMSSASWRPWCRARGVSDFQYRDEKHKEQVTCQACIEAWETEPQPVTTANLVEVIKVLVEDTEHTRFNLENLIERLKRPRSIKS